MKHRFSDTSACVPIQTEKICSEYVTLGSEGVDTLRTAVFEQRDGRSRCLTETEGETPAQYRAPGASWGHLQILLSI